jgi:hypothetical protein
MCPIEKIHYCISINPTPYASLSTSLAAKELLLFDNQYFTKDIQTPKKIPENRGAGAEGPAPLFSGLAWLFRDLLII